MNEGDQSYAGNGSGLVNFRPLSPEFFGAAGPRWFRSGTLAGVDRETARHLRHGLGIRTFIDLRGEVEIARAEPPRTLLAAGIEWLRAPVGGYAGDPISAPVPTSDDYVAYYRSIVETAREAWRAAVATVDGRGPAPLVFGCHAGKDRTGILAAILLDRAGAPAELIAGDYALSGDLLAGQVDRFRDKWTARGMSREAYARRMRTPPETMTRFLAEMRLHHGGLAHYVLSGP